MPGTGLRVHRGTTVNPLILHLHRWIAGPPRTWRDILSLHEEGVGGEHGAVTHGHAVEDECTDPQRAAGANRRSVAFERAVLLRMALYLAPVVEDRLVSDRGERRVGDVGAVVEDPPTDSHADQPPEHVLERRAIERVEIVNRIQLPEALGQPEIAVVDGADRRLQRAQRFDATVHQGEVDRGDHDAEREAHRAHYMGKRIVQLEGGEVERREHEDADPACEEEETDGPQVIPILYRKAAAQRLPRPEMVELRVTLNGARNLETGGAQQAEPFAPLAVERNHHLRPEEDVVARAAARGIHDVVAYEVARPDCHSGYAERGARDLVIHQNQPVGDHRSGAHGAQTRVRVHHLADEIRPGLLDWAKVITQPLQVVDDVGAVSEKEREEPHPPDPCDRAVHRVMEAVERIDRVRLDEPVQHARSSDGEQEPDEREAEENYQ